MRRKVCRLSRTTPGWLQLNISKQGFWDLVLGGTIEEQLGNERRMPWELASSLLLQWLATTRITNLWGRTMSSWDRRCNLSVDQWRAAMDPNHTSWLRSSPFWVPWWTGRWEGSAWVQKRCMEQSRCATEQPSGRSPGFKIWFSCPRSSNSWEMLRCQACTRRQWKV